MKRSGQTSFVSLAAEFERQELGHWPGPAYLRARTLLGSPRLGFKQLGAENNSAGSDFLIQLVKDSTANGKNQ